MKKDNLLIILAIIDIFLLVPLNKSLAGDLENVSVYNLKKTPITNFEEHFDNISFDNWLSSLANDEVKWVFKKCPFYDNWKDSNPKYIENCVEVSFSTELVPKVVLSIATGNENQPLYKNPRIRQLYIVYGKDRVHFATLSELQDKLQEISKKNKSYNNRFERDRKKRGGSKRSSLCPALQAKRYNAG